MVGEVTEISFDVLDPALIVLNRVEADVPVASLHPPRICHEAAFTDFHGTLTICLNNPLFISSIMDFQQVVSPSSFRGARCSDSWGG